MEEFCGSQFWNHSLTWNASSQPDFTPCFEKTVLVWIPCLFLWGFAPLETHYLIQSKDGNIPWSSLNVSKIIGSLVLLIVELTLLISNIANSNGDVYGVDYLAPCLLFISILLQLIMVIMEKKRGFQSSAYLFLFWMLMVLCGIPAYRTYFLSIENEAQDSTSVGFITYMIYYPVVVIMFLLNFFADKKPQKLYYPRGEKYCPEDDSSFPSRLTFSWLDGLVWRGYKNPVTQDMLWDLSYDNTSLKVTKDWDRHWTKTTQNSYKKEESRTRATFAKDSNRVLVVGTSGKKHYLSIFPTMLRTFGRQFLFGSMLKLVHDLLQFVSPFLISLLISYTEDISQPKWHGYLYAILFLVVTQVQSFFLGQYFIRMFVIGLKIRTAVISAVYRKALRISSSARKESTLGEIVNLMSVDAQRFMDLTTYLNMIWSAPLQIALCLYFLWQILGPSVLAGLAIMIVLIPINGLVANQQKKLQIKQMKEKDQRVKLMNEILNGIKVLKLYAWEPSFEKQVLGIRGKEIKVLKKSAYLNAATSFMWVCTPFMISFFMFMTFVLSDPQNVLTPDVAFVSLTLMNIMRMPMTVLPTLIISAVQVSLTTFAVYVLVSESPLDAHTAFVSITLFNMLRFPMTMLPMMITSLVQASVSLKRMNKFLNADELNPNAVSKEGVASSSITVENGSFAWGHSDSDKDILKGIDLSVKEGSLVGVVGSVGAGKSSLCSAILGEMEKTSGKVTVKGSVAYVSQQAWIQNSTLENNILFGKNNNPRFYSKVINACALRTDFDILPAGDQTEIGEKGINLSGGQKQRVSLARAVYADAQIYLLDDPLSAVDSHVGKHIFERVIGPQGMLKKRTRLLVTHGLTYLRDMDHIVVLKGGKVSEQGTYLELIAKKGEFQEFLLQYLSEGRAEEEEGFEEIKSELEKSIGRQAVERQISRKRENSESSADGRKRSLEFSRSGSFKERDDSETSKTPAQANGPTPTPAQGAKSGEKLIEAEKAETGRVSMAVYGYYMRAIGVFASAMTIFFFAASQGFSVGSNVWLSEWSEDENATQKAVRDKYLGVYGGLGIFQVVTVVLAFTILARAAVLGSKVLHNKMLWNLLRNPCSFFDTTPTGRIVNRFSKDVDTIDILLPMNLRSLVLCLMSVMTGSLIHFFAVSVFASTFVLYLGTFRAAISLHSRLLNNVLHMPMQFFDTNPVGRVLNRFSKDIDALDNTLPMNLRSWVMCVGQVIATLVVIIYATPMFVVVLVPVMGIYYFVQLLYVTTSRQLKRIESVSRSPIYSHFGESIQGAATIRAYDKEDEFILESQKKVDFNQISYYPSIIANRWLAIRLEFIGNILTFFAALFAVMSRDNNITGGVVGLSVSYALSVTQTLNWLVRMTSDVETNIVAVERIKEYTEIPQEAAWEVEEKRPPKDWPDKGVVEFENYSTRYREELDLVVKGIQCKIEPTEKVGIVGRTGAGKSSLTLALFRIIEPAGGSIVIDDVDIARIGLHDLRKNITIIPQDPVLFSGTLRMNLDPFCQHSDEGVWGALEHSHLKMFVSELNAKLQHEITEGGENLSVGQRQLVCLARALLRKTKVLILDEATAAVDLETDDLIQETIRREFSECTVLTIAHRLNTIMDSTRVLVMDQGVIKEFDSPSNLLKNPSSIFYGMAKDAGLA